MGVQVSPDAGRVGGEGEAYIHANNVAAHHQTTQPDAQVSYQSR